MKDLSTFEELVKAAHRFQEKETLTVKIGEILSRKTADDVAIALELVILKSSRGDSASQRILSCLLDIREFSRHFGPHRIYAVYEYAREHGHREVERLLRRYREKRIPASDGDNPFIPELEEMTLGEKKYRARTGCQHILDKFAHDLSPEVIENLLKNPRTTERVVLKAASRRPSNPRVLEVIARNPKWFSRYRVKKALASNPYTPVHIAIGLLNFLLKQDLKELAESSEIHEEVKKAAEELLKQRQ